MNSTVGAWPSGAALFVTAVFLALAATGASGVDYVVDQENTWTPLEGYECSIVYFSPIGQEFVPSLASLDVVEVVLRHGGPIGSGPSVVEVQVRSGSMDGEVLGVSAPVVIPEDIYEHIVAFDFAGSVSLVPGELYVIEVLRADGANAMLLVDDMLSNDSYPEGHAIRNGEPDARKDIWFREGPREETAVGSTSWSRIKALYR